MSNIEKLSTENKKTLENISQKYIHNNELLTYEEVLCDKNLTAKLKKDNAKLSCLAEDYLLLKGLYKEQNDLLLKQKSFSNEQSELLEKDLFSLQNRIQELTSKILTNLVKFDAKEQEITIEINSKKDNELSCFLCKLYENTCKNNSFEYNLSKENDNFTIQICGLNAYETFKNESGIHRYLNKNTSFDIFVFVYLRVRKQEFVFDENDIRIDVYHSSGAGGQNINKVSTAIRVTHLKTNIAVACQNERTQLQNKNKALELLNKKVSAYYENIYQKNIKKVKKEIQNKILQGYVRRTYDYLNESEMKALLSGNLEK